MNKTKKIVLTLLLILALPLGARVIAFTDVPWTGSLYEGVSYMAAKEIIKGYEDDTFGVDDPINRAAALKVILTAAEVDILEETVDYYKDVPKEAWFAPYVTTAVKEGILTIDEGDENPEFRPSDEVNRAAFIKMMLATFGINPGKFNTGGIHINDVSEDAWFAKYMAFVVKFNILELTEQEEALPSQTVTRGEAVDLLYKTLRQGGGLSPQVLLHLTEDHLVQTIEKIEAEQIPGAGLAVDVAEKFIVAAAKALPENNIILGAHKTVLAVKNLVGAFAAGEHGRVDDVLAASGKAWDLANEAGELNPAQKPMTEAIKHLSHGLASKTREVKDKVAEERAKQTQEGIATTNETAEDKNSAPKEVTTSTPQTNEPHAEKPETENKLLSEEELLMKKLEELRAKKKAEAEVEAKRKAAEEEAKKKAEEAAKKEVEKIPVPATPTPTAAPSGGNVIVKAQLAALQPVLEQINDSDPMKAIVTAQLSALKQVLLQPNFNKDIVLAQLNALSPIISQFQNEGMKGIILAQLEALKQVVTNM